MRALAKNIAVRAALGTGRWLHRKKATVLYYHRFHPQFATQFRGQCEYLRKRHHVISMRELTQLLRNGDSPPANAVVLTIDDGHRDFYACAFPILRDYGFPATMYLPTAFLDRAKGREWLWFDRLSYAFSHSSRGEVEIPARAPGEPPANYRLESAAARAVVAGLVVEGAQRLPIRDRDIYCEAVEDALKIHIPEMPPEEFAPLTWDEVRTMVRCGIEFGGHTVTHPILQTIETAAELEFEIAHCKLRIEEELQAPVAHFAYPRGKVEDIPAAAKEAVRRAGYETAVTTLIGQAGAGDDPLWLQRIGVAPEVEQLWFQRCAAAVRIA
jgi:peptidoglycan/xylan/chitin deacetylase (PgdA/CDA1 family)